MIYTMVLVNFFQKMEIIIWEILKMEKLIKKENYLKNQNQYKELSGKILLLNQKNKLEKILKLNLIKMNS